MQACWIIAHVASRSARGLSPTLLEVHTVAQVVCALFMYAIWWHEPRQVESPTLLKGDWLWPLTMYMFLASQMSGEAPKAGQRVYETRYYGSKRWHMSSTRSRVISKGSLGQETSESLNYVAMAMNPLHRFQMRSSRANGNSQQEPCSCTQPYERGFPLSNNILFSGDRFTATHTLVSWSKSKPMPLTGPMEAPCGAPSPLPSA